MSTQTFKPGPFYFYLRVCYNADPIPRSEAALRSAFLRSSRVSLAGFEVITLREKFSNSAVAIVVIKGCPGLGYTCFG